MHGPLNVKLEKLRCRILRGFRTEHEFNHMQHNIAEIKILDNAYLNRVNPRYNATLT